MSFVEDTAKLLCEAQTLARDNGLSGNDINIIKGKPYIKSNCIPRENIRTYPVANWRNPDWKYRSGSNVAETFKRFGWTPPSERGTK